MTIKELLDLANEDYTEGHLARYYDADGQFVDGSGDTLARFIVRELIETFDQATSTVDQLYEARHVIERGTDDIRAVFEKLHEAYQLEAALPGSWTNAMS